VARFFYGGSHKTKITALIGADMFGFELKIVVLAVLVVIGSYVILRFINRRK
jgi:hypothetical protein